MKRKYSDRANWRRVTEKKFQVRTLHEPEFQGYVVLYQIKQVRDPLWKEYDGKRYCVADAGYEWLQHFQKGAHYIMTSMFNDKGQVVQYYIDICKVQGVTDRGVPWFDDLYLDVVILPGGELFLLDAEELEDALKKGIITREDFDMAWAEANKVMEMYREGRFPLLKLSGKHWGYFHSRH